MNPRTLLPNEQLSELITAVSSNRKNDLPEQRQDGAYMGAWAELDRQARITMEIANKGCLMPDPPDNSMINMAAGLAVLVLTVIVLKRYGIIK